MKNTFKTMKRLMLSGLIIAAIAGCSSPADKEKENIALVDRYIEAVENLDYQTMSSLLADDYIGYGPDYGDSITREAAVENWKYVADNIYDKIDYRKSNNVAMRVTARGEEGDWVSNWSELYIRYKNGREVMLWANCVYQIKDGKISKTLTFYNEMDALRQLGFRVVSSE